MTIQEIGEYEKEEAIFRPKNNSLYQQPASVQQVGREDNSPSKLLVPLKNKNIQVSQFALVDTDNIISSYGGTAIDEQLAKKLQLNIQPDTLRNGTGAKDNYLQAVGRAIGLRIMINETKRVLIVNPVVICNFSIGLKFLMSHGCVLKFGPNNKDNKIKFKND